MSLRDSIRTIPDHPKPGIMFRDVTTLLGDAAALQQAINELVAPFEGQAIAKVAGIEARGFIIGGAVADRLGAGFVPLRKKGKLPHRTYAVEYALEYGSDCIEMHMDGVMKDEGVLLIDDLIATGGTALAAIDLLRQAGAHVIGAGFIVDLPELGGAARVRDAGVPVTALVSFEGH